MKKKRFDHIDILLLILIILPIAGCIVLKVLFTPEIKGISITGPMIFYTVHMPIQDLDITESLVNSAAVLIAVFWLCIFLTRGLKTRPERTRQIVAEWIVEKTEALVKNNMGEYFKGFPPFVAAIMGLSAMSSLLSLFGLFPPTSDINIIAGWAVLVFVLITYYKMKCGPWVYAKSFADPIALTPLNVISEVATPVSMAFRHYGNVLSGSVVSVLVGAALQGLSAMLFSWLPGAFAKFPYLRIGIPAVLSVYFDLFSGGLQAFIFAMLTMLYVANGFPEELYFKRRQKKLEKKININNKVKVR